MTCRLGVLALGDSITNGGGEPVVVNRDAEAHEAPTAPGADGDMSGIAHPPRA